MVLKNQNKSNLSWFFEHKLIKNTFYLNKVININIIF